MTLLSVPWQIHLGLNDNEACNFLWYLNIFSEVEKTYVFEIKFWISIRKKKADPFSNSSLIFLHKINKTGTR